MARRSHSDALGVTGAQTIIGTGVILKGNLTSDSDITIDGALEGQIKTSGNLTIGINGRIKANVTAVNVTVSGSLKGDILAEGEAVVTETGQVQGDIQSEGLAISPGAVFIGRSSMRQPEHLEAENEDKA